MGASKHWPVFRSVSLSFPHGLVEPLLAPCAPVVGVSLVVFLSAVQPPLVAKGDVRGAHAFERVKS